MRQTFFLSLIVIVSFSCSTDKKESANELMKEAVAPNGLKTYNRYCVVCHGDEGNAKVGGALDLSISSLTADERFHIIKNGSDNKHMRAFGDDLTEAEIKAVATHLETLLNK